jgi:tetratricopeptide (TPR) repeat protein
MKKLSMVVVMAASMSAAAYAAPPQTGVKPVARASSLTASGEALSKGDTLEALTRADEALRADPKNAWAHYNRAAALAGLNRIDEAVAAYDQAAGAFAASDKRGKSLALWGKAHVLYRTGKCAQATEAFAEYTKFVGSSDPQATELASHRSTTCHQAGSEAEATAMPSTKADATTVAASPAKGEGAKSALPSIAKPEGEGKSAMPSLSKP